MKKSLKKLSFIGVILIIGTIVNLSMQNKEIEVMAQNEKEISYKNYINERFGFSGVYPDFLTERFESENGDGVILRDKNNEVILIMSGINNILNENSEMLLKDDKKDKSIIYEKNDVNSYTLSWAEGNKVKYNYRLIGEGTIQGFLIEYPKAKENEFKNIIKKIETEFKAGNLDSFS